MTKINLPSSVKIGYRTYRIVEWRPQDAVAARRYGEASSMNEVLRIDTQWSRRKIAHTLLHEIIHAVFEAWNVCDDDKEERTNEALSNGLAAVWRDNSEVFAWIGRHLK